MSTDTADRFTSKFRQQRQTGAGGGTRDRRRVFESGNDDTTKNSVSSSGVAGRYRSTGDRGEKTEASSVSSRLSKLNTNDDKEDDTEKSSTENKHQDEEDAEEQASSRKSHRKAGGASAKSGQKRRDRKNLREKRRSTGVVIMPGQPGAAPADDEEKQLQENTVMNTEPTNSQGSDRTDSDLTKQIEAYESSIEEWKDELAKAKREIEALQKDNQRLKDENSALLRVVGSLSGPRK